MRPFLQYLVQGFETRIFEMECQYSLLFRRFESDQRKFVSYNINLYVSTLCLPEVIERDFISQAFLLHFWIMQVVVTACE